MRQGRRGRAGRAFRGAGSDAMAWADEFGVARDVSALSAEKNVLRYRPVPVTIRHEDDASMNSCVWSRPVSQQAPL